MLAHIERKVSWPCQPEWLHHLPAVAHDHFSSFFIKALGRPKSQVPSQHKPAFTFGPSLTAVSRMPPVLPVSAMAGSR